jgi:hypothetical protein
MKRAFWLCSAALVVLSGLWMIEVGIYGWTIFVVLPVALGALGGCLAKTAWRSVGYGAYAVALATLSFLVVGKEGIGCILISWPIMLPMGALGGFLAHAFLRRSEWTRPVSTFAILPLLTLGFDVTARPPVYEVQTSIEIAAPPERVWKDVVSFRDLPVPSEWYFHTGLAYPTRTRIDGSGVGAIRYCEFSTGAMVEPIRVWQEGRVLQFDVSSSPEPLTEWTLYGKPHPRHLNGYLIANAASSASLRCLMAVHYSRALAGISMGCALAILAMVVGCDHPSNPFARAAAHQDALGKLAGGDSHPA